MIVNDVTSFKNLIEDLLLLDNVMISIKSENAIAEIKLAKDLPIKIGEQWATIGDENKSWHIHVNIQETYEARFIIESNVNGRNRYSIRFFNSKEGLILRVNFTKMYDSDNNLNQENLEKYENIFTKYGNNNSVFLKDI
ncbi:MAG: hypothetical protein H0X03_03165 [Nitrosopumilus sp.]|nr:hypothetical protein [Nitrosopumilus sp.]